MKKINITISFICIGFLSLSQDSTKAGNLNLSAVADAYYQYDFNKPVNKERPAFLYNYKKHNQPNINLTLVKAAYIFKKFRAKLGLMAGTYADYNLAAEPSLFRRVFEADIGYVISGKFSIDAGIMPSHIGFESAIAKDNWNLSRSILAENSPYYETGIKLNYLPNNKWTISFLVLNGWQNIKENNSSKAIGTQVQFKPSEKWLINSSTFIGNEKPDTAKQLRLFHNFFAIYAITTKLNIAVLFDAGLEKQLNSKKYAGWFGSALLFQYNFSSTIKSAARIEYYSDIKGIIIPRQNLYGLQTTGSSLNIDYYPINFLLLRMEGRLLNSGYNYFLKNGEPVHSNFALLGSVVLFFDKVFL